MSFLVSDNPIEVEIEYVEIGPESLIVIAGESQKEIFEGKIKTAKSKWSRPNWSNFNIYIFHYCVTH